MMVRDARSPAGRDEGPYRRPLTLPTGFTPLPESAGSGWGSTSRVWLASGRTEKAAPAAPFDRVAYNREHRAANPEHYRALERERSRRRREKLREQRASTVAA